MNMNVKSPFDLHCFSSRKILVAVVLTIVIVLASFCFVTVFNGVSPSAPKVVYKVVNNEIDLRDTIKNAPSKTSIVINVSGDIFLSSTIIIPINKDITLTSDSKNGFYKLIGASGATITVNGSLTIDGIIVTHAEDSYGVGVIVDSGGSLILSDGKISGNVVTDDYYYSGVYFPVGVGDNGGGVYNDGYFSMTGGEISNNFVDLYGFGGGVYNSGVFNMSGGVITNNTAYGGYGVYTCGDFAMSGGKISGNIANVFNGGQMCGSVHNSFGNFNLMNGEISNNTDGVYNSGGAFTMSGGVISNNSHYGVYNGGVFNLLGGVIANNTALRGNTGGGVYNGGGGNFSMTGGIITNNTGISYPSIVSGGGVENNGIFNLLGGAITRNISYNGGGVGSNNIFNMFGGEISGNTASNRGGGVCIGSGLFQLTGGKISDNTASYSGGGVWVDAGNLGNLFVSDGVEFSDNSASTSYNRDSAYDTVYNSNINRNVIWTSPFVQGYNNYDIGYLEDVY